MTLHRNRRGASDGSPRVGHAAAERDERRGVFQPNRRSDLAGRAGDPFWIEPDVPACSRPLVAGRNDRQSQWLGPVSREELFAGHSVHSLVLEIPDKELTAAAKPERKIGVWAVASPGTDAGGWRSINRVGLPMIHPLFTQYDEDLGNRLNGGRPADDFATSAKPPRRRLQGRVRAIGTAEDPEGYATRVARRSFRTWLLTRSGRQRCSVSATGTVAP